MSAAFIAGDWGTSHLRLYLCDAMGTALARAEGPGVSAIGTGGDFAGTLAGLAAPWDAAHGKLPAILGGMVGSTIGWREAAYLPCPARAEAIAGATLDFESDGRRIVIAPGLNCRNLCDLPDVMRGEEVQILGALRLNPALARGRHVICLPGTHTKWALIEAGAVVRFQTALSGELFELLSRHSVLARGSGPVDSGSSAFADGLRIARNQRALLHLLFSTRSRQLAGEIAREDAASYLSGLVLGADVGAAMRLLDLSGTIHLVCSPLLAELYASALVHYGLAAASIDGDAASLAGLATIHAEKMP